MLAEGFSCPAILVPSSYYRTLSSKAATVSSGNRLLVARHLVLLARRLFRDFYQVGDEHFIVCFRNLSSGFEMFHEM